MTLRADRREGGPPLGPPSVNNYLFVVSIMLSLLAVICGGLMIWAFDHDSAVGVNSLGIVVLSAGTLGFVFSLFARHRF